MENQVQNQSEPAPMLNVSFWTVHQLRKAGWKVQVHHQRYIDRRPQWKMTLGGERVRVYEGPRLVPIRTAREHVKPGSDFIYLPCGGQTAVRVTDPRGYTYIGTAFCSLRDNFCYRRGVTIALGRLLYQCTEKREVEEAVKKEEAVAAKM